MTKEQAAELLFSTGVVATCIFIVGLALCAVVALIRGAWRGE